MSRPPHDDDLDPRVSCDAAQTLSVATPDDCRMGSCSRPDQRAGLRRRTSQLSELDEPQLGVWRRWKFERHVPEEKGTYILKSRATDTQDNSQPDHHDKRFGTYVIHHTFGIEVGIRSWLKTSAYVYFVPWRTT